MWAAWFRLFVLLPQGFRQSQGSLLSIKKKRVRAGKPLRATLNPLGMGMQSYLSLHCEATKDEGYLKTDDLPKIGWCQEKEFGTTTIPILSLLIGRN